MSATGDFPITDIRDGTRTPDDRAPVRVLITKPSTGKIVEFGKYRPLEAERMAAALRKHGIDAHVEERAS
jgi:hypothetical protein